MTKQDKKFIETCLLLSEQFREIAELKKYAAKTKSKWGKEATEQDIDTLLNTFIPHNIKILVQQ